MKKKTQELDVDFIQSKPWYYLKIWSETYI